MDAFPGVDDMTDLATRPDSDEQADTAVVDGSGDAPAYAWAPAEPKPKKNRSAVWIGIPAGATVAALIAASLVLIAPGASVAGVNVGGLTPGAAAEAIAARLASTTLVIDGPEGTAELTGADLGATVDANAIAEAAFAENPMWNPSTWFPGSVDATVSLDAATATEALRAVAPDYYVDPVDAAVGFDAATASFVVTDAVPGQGIDVDTVRAALQSAFDAGRASATLPAEIVPVDPPATTDAAATAAASLNGMLDTVGFYVGEERTVPVDRAVAASWLTVTPGADGGFTVSADQNAIQAVVDTLPAAINRDPVDATVITDSAGTALSDITPGVVGRALDATDGLAAQAAASLAEGNAVFPVTVTETPFATTNLERRIEVNLSTQRTILYENDQVVQSWAISSGKNGATGTGNFRIGWKTSMQNMGNRDTSKAPFYFTPDVPWVSYFNGDIAFHGTYWHNNFGTPMSHGCINMPISAAKYVYDWAPKGVEVNVHY